MKHYKYNIFISYSTKYFIHSDATYKMLPKNVNLSLLTPLINTHLKKISVCICNFLGHTNLLRASMLPEGLTSRWLSCEAVSEVSWRSSGMGAVSIASGLGLLSSEVRGKIIGMDRGLALGNFSERRGRG